MKDQSLSISCFREMADLKHGPNLQNIRRFSLVIGLSLITFSLAGVEIQADEVLRPLGFPLKISEPGLVLPVLVIASVYAIIRFSFYGIFFAGTPRRRRKELWKDMGPHQDMDTVAEGLGGLGVGGSAGRQVSPLSRDEV